MIIGLRDAADATWTETLDAVNDADSSSFYYFNIESRVDGDIAQACAWAETKTAQAGPPKLFRAQSPDIALTEFLAQQALARVRSFGTFHGVSTGSSDGYVDGAWWSAFVSRWCSVGARMRERAAGRAMIYIKQYIKH